jgi:hypothetical protein
MRNEPNSDGRGMGGPTVVRSVDNVIFLPTQLMKNNIVNTLKINRV